MREEPKRPILKNALSALGARTDLIGKRYINWLRCSTDPQGENSPDGQKHVNDNYASTNGMLWVGDVLASGVSGSQTFNRADIGELIKKAKENNATKVVVFELSRATRGGIRHGNVVEDELRKAGLELISSTELIPEGPIGELLKSIKHFANQQQAVSISRSVTRGLSQAVARGVRPSAAKSPIGFDRLYFCAKDNSHRAIIRWDGLTQIRIDPKTGLEVSRAVMDTPRDRRKAGDRKTERECFKGYKKQGDEHSIHIPGSPAKVEAVRTMFRLYYLENWGLRQIAQHISSLGIANSKGDTQWFINTIKRIVQNPLYCGIEINNRYQCGLYHTMGENGPISITVDQDKLEAEGRVKVPVTERPRSEWVLKDVPHLKDFLPANVRAAALEHLNKLYDSETVTAKQARYVKRKHKSDNNDFVLSKLFCTAKHKYVMTGCSKKWRKYKHPRRYYFSWKPQSVAFGGDHCRLIQAAPLEDAVVPAIMETFRDQEWIADRVKAAMEGLSFDSVDVSSRTVALEKERDEVTKRLTRIHRTSSHLNDDELDALVKDDNDRIVAIRIELGELRRQREEKPPTMDEAVAAVRAKLSALPQDWRDMPKAEVKAFLRAVVHSMEIDVETLAVNLSLRLPKSAFQPVPHADLMQPVRCAVEKDCSPDAPPSHFIEIAQITCTGSRNPIGPQCFTCSRSNHSSRQAA